jgi:hypothetical protein
VYPDTGIGGNIYGQLYPESNGFGFTPYEQTIFASNGISLGLNSIYSAKLSNGIISGYWYYANGNVGGTIAVEPTLSSTEEPKYSPTEEPKYSPTEEPKYSPTEESQYIPTEAESQDNSGSISVASDPNGASIYIDGTYEGEAPKTFEDVEQGSHKITLNLTGYEDWSQTIIVHADKTFSLSPKLSLKQEKPLNTPTEPSESSASINLHGEKTNVSMGEDIQLKLSAVNIITKPTMHTQVILTPPSGMSVSSSDFVDSGAGQYTATFDLEPGKGKDIEVRIKANQVGNFNVKGRVIYYFGDDKKNGLDYPLILPIQVSDTSVPTPVSTSESNKESNHSTPGFGFTSLVFILLLVFIIKRK